MKKVKLASLILTLVGFTACSGGGGSGSSGAAIGNVGTSGAGGSFGDIAAAVSGWTSNCVQGVNVQSKDIMSTTGSSLVINSTLYDDASNCVDGLKFRGIKTTYSVLTSGTNSVETNSTNIDIAPTKLEMIAYTVGAANDLNIGAECGKTDWVANQWVDVTSMPCFSSSVFYTIFRINGNNLNFGDSSGMNDGSTALKRPTSLNMSYTFTK